MLLKVSFTAYVCNHQQAQMSRNTSIVAPAYTGVCPSRIVMADTNCCVERASVKSGVVDQLSRLGVETQDASIHVVPNCLSISHVNSPTANGRQSRGLLQIQARRHRSQRLPFDEGQELQCSLEELRRPTKKFAGVRMAVLIIKPCYRLLRKLPIRQSDRRSRSKTAVVAHSKPLVVLAAFRSRRRSDGCVVA